MAVPLVIKLQMNMLEQCNTEKATLPEIFKTS